MSSSHSDVPTPADRGNTPDSTGLAAQIVQLKLDASSDLRLQTPPLGAGKSVSAATTPSTTASSSPAPPRGLTSSPVTARLHAAAALTPPKATVLSEERTARERPHSYTGGLSTADLRKLQMGTLNIEPDPSASRGATPVTAKPTKQWPTFNSEDAYASLSSSTNGRPGSSSSQSGSSFPIQEDMESEFTIQQQTSRPPPQPQPLPAGAPRINQSPAVAGFPRGPSLGAPYHPNQRSYSPAIQGGMPMQSPPATYTTFGQPLSVYDLMPSGAVDPSLARLQQQQLGGGQNFRPIHGMSSGDPTANMMPAMMSMGGFAGSPGPALYSPPPGALSHHVPPPPSGLGMYANGGAGAGAPFYTPQELYAHADASLSAAARMQQQYLANAYNSALPQPPNAALNQLAAASVNLQAAAVAAVAAVNATNPAVSAGPSANNRKLGLYKTELCRSWEEKGTCRYGTKCQFAHSQDELRGVQRHPKYKTEICRTFWVSGSCPYGKRCCFIHTDVPAGGLPPGADGTPPPMLVSHSRSHSSSTVSDSAEGPSLLQRISAQRAQGVVSSASQTPIDKPATPTSAGFGRPGGLRVDTASLGGVSTLAKENKSAYPSFPQGPNPLKPHPAPEPSSALSPLPFTAHPDTGGRRGAGLAHLDVGAASQARMGKAKAASPNNRHSFNGTDLGLDFSNVGPGSLATPVQTAGGTFARSSGHMRSGSAGNWAALSRSSRLASSPYSPIPSADVNTTSPWTASNSELTSLT